MDYDLNGRDLALPKTPSLDEFVVTRHDPWTDLLFTGNIFYTRGFVI